MNGYFRVPAGYAEAARERNAVRQAEWDASPASAAWERAYAERQARTREKLMRDPAGMRAYQRAHRAVFDRRGHAVDHACFCGCGERAAHWAFQHGREESGRWSGSPYGPPASYEPMAAGCHKRYDNAHRAA